MIQQNSTNIQNHFTQKNHFVFFLLIFFSTLHTNVLSQEESSKELLKKIESHKKQDTVKVRLYSDLANALFGEDNKESMVYAWKSHNLAKKLNDTKSIASAYHCLGNIYFRISKPDSSLLFFQKEFSVYKSTNEVTQYAGCLNSIGATYYIKSDYASALKYFEKSIATNKKYNKSPGLSAYNNIGSVYGRMREYNKAIYYFSEILRLELESGDSSTLNLAYNNLGVVYESKGDQPKALECYQKANRIEKKKGDEYGLMTSYSNIGRIYADKKEYEKALSYIEKSIKIAMKYDNKHTLIKSLMLEGVVYEELNEFGKALQIQEKSLRISREIGAKESIASGLGYLGNALVKVDSLDRALECYEEALQINIEIEHLLGIPPSYRRIGEIYATRKQWDKALKYATKAKETAHEYTHLRSLHKAYELLGEIYENTGEFEEAYYHHKKYTEYKDSIYNEENDKKLAELEYEYIYSDSLEQASKRELTLSNKVKQGDLDSAKSEQFILWLVIGLLLIVILAVSIISYLVVKNTRTKLKNIEVEQKLLRTQMTPHFLFNSMSIIQGMILDKSYDKSLDYLNDFSKLLRLTLENSRNKTVSLEKELEAINSYISLQNKTSKQPYKCQIHLDSSTDPKRIFLPPMLIQPFIENAIEHGFDEEMLDKRINITIQFIEGDLVCVITDNGIGIDQTIADKKTTKTSMATQITKDRLKLLASEFKVRTNFSIKDRTVFSEKGTVINLVLPYKRLAND